MSLEVLPPSTSKPQYSAGSTGPGHPRKRRLFLLATAATIAYSAILGLLAYYGYVAFVWKSAIVPVFLGIAALSRRFERFLSDWLVYLSLTVLFDATRGLIYGWIVSGNREIWVEYPFLMDQLIFRIDHGLNAALQEAWYRGAIGWLEYCLVFVHASHFVVFLGFGFLLWYVMPKEFHRYWWAVVIVMALGLLGYAAIPTAPPWLARSLMPQMPTVLHISADIYTASMPRLHVALDTNPVAAMPSLHAAFPTLVALFAVRSFGKGGLLAWAYFACVTIALVYLGEHYGVDIIAGGLVAVFAFLAVRPLSLDAARLPGDRLSWQVAAASTAFFVGAAAIGEFTFSLLAHHR